MSITILYIAFVIGLFFISNVKRELLLVSIFTIASVNPVIEKLTDPTLFGAGWNNVNYNRIWPELLLTFFLVFNVRLLKVTKLSILNTKNESSLFFAGWFILSLLALAFSHDFNRSTLLLICSFINPLLIFIVVHDVLYNAHFKEKLNERLSTLFSIIFIVFFVVGIIVYIKSDSLLSLLSFGDKLSRTTQNLWVGQFGVQTVILFFPFILIYPAKYKLNIIAIVLLLLGTALSMSRTTMLLVVLGFVFAIVVKGRKALNWKWIIGIIAIMVYFAETILIYFELVGARFLQTFNSSGGVNDEVEIEDGRVGIYAEAFELIEDYPLFGIGQGLFYKFHPHHYTDAHNAILSIAVETGLPAALFCVLFLYSFFKYPKSKENNVLKVGLVLFILGTLTGNQFFINSGYVSGIRADFLFMALAIMAFYGEQAINKKKV